MTESTVERIVHVKDITGGPGALGLLGYGLPIIMVSLANAGLIESGSMILGMIRQAILHFYSYMNFMMGKTYHEEWK